MAFVRPPQLVASFIPELHTPTRRLGIVFLKPFFRGVRGGEDLGVIEDARILEEGRAYRTSARSRAFP
jgi:hypothetical protein